MKLRIEIEMDNAAFGEDGYQRAQEVDRVLAEYFLDRELNPKSAGFLRDSNGNKVGEWQVTKC